MTDIAKLGFDVNTKPLKDATAALNAVTAAAGGAGKASVQLATANRQSAQAALQTLQATKNASKADIEAARVALQLARAKENEQRALLNASKAAQTNASALNNLERASRGAAGGFGGAGGSRGGSGPRGTGLSATGVGRDQMPNRFNTANIAAQFQDIGVTAAMGMNPMTIALQQGTQLSAVLTPMPDILRGLADGLKQIISPLALMTIGVTALVAILIQVTDWVKVGQAALNGLADTLEFIEPAILPIGAAMLVAFGPATIAAIFTASKAVLLFGAAVLKAGAMAAAGWIMANPVTAFVAILGAIGVFVVSAVKPIRDFVNTVIGYFIGLWNGVKEIWGNIGKLIKGGSVFSDANKIISAEIGKATGKDYVGGIGEGIESGVKAAADKLREISAGLGKDDKSKASKKDPWKELVKGAERNLATLEAEQKAIGKTAEQAAFLKHETDLLNQAQQKNIELTDGQRLKIRELAGDMAKAEETNRKLSESFNFGTGVIKGFFTDINSGLKEGKSLWRSFADAAVNALNKIADAMFDMMAQDIAVGLYSGSGVGDFFKGMFGAKNGAAFSQSGVQPFAKGGAFTNSIVSSPTLFQFANGSKFGVMGEAGAEAVMPLHRGSDGSLGVRVEGGASNTKVVVNVNNNSNAQATVNQRQTANGVEIDVLIDQAVARNIGQSGTSTNSALSAYISRGITRR